ncbi:MAG: protein kinase [Anaerolineaceae bacterium]
MKELLGKKLKGRYRVDALVGRGGMAEVYKVWDEARADALAMKVLREDLAQDKIFLRRFEREAQTLAKLQHRSIVRFYGLEQDDVLVFLLLEYIEGTSLREEIFRCKKPFSLQQALEVLRPVCAAMHYAHQLGIVHCDLKPGNILINKHGEFLVTDFGVARMVDASTSTMVGIGTPAYMAPELIKGEDPTPQTDIYALGVILYEMLTGGERPFTGERAETTGSTAEKIRWEQLKLIPKPLLEFNPDLPVAVQTLVQCCLAKLPAQRFADIQEVYAELHRLADCGEGMQSTYKNEAENSVSHSVRDFPPVKELVKTMQDPQTPIKKTTTHTIPKRVKADLPLLTHIRTQKGMIHDFDLYKNKIVISTNTGLIIQDIQKGNSLQRFGEFKNCGQVKFHSGDERIIFRWEDSLAIVDTKSNSIIGDLRNIVASPIVQLSVVQNIDYCVGLDEERGIIIWDLNTRKITGLYSNHVDRTSNVILSPSRHVIKISETDYIHMLSLPDLKILRRIKSGNLLKMPDLIKNLICSNSGGLLITWDRQPLLQIIKFLHYRSISKSIDLFNPIHSAAISQKETFLLTIDEQGSFTIWNTETLHEIDHFISGKSGIDKVLISENEQYVVTLSKDQRLDVWKCNWNALPREGER